MLKAVAITAGGTILPADTIVTEAGTSKTLSAADNGKILYFTSGSPITVTCATGLGVAYSVTMIQGGAGRITVNAGAATRQAYNALYSSMGQYAVISAICPVADLFILAGNLGV